MKFSPRYENQSCLVGDVCGLGGLYELDAYEAYAGYEYRGFSLSKRVYFPYCSTGLALRTFTNFL